MPLKPASITWDLSQPRATDFDDIYFSKDAEQETHRIFIEPSAILDRARQQHTVCVGELGFGTGLNFAVLAQQILTETDAKLRFISFEKFPLRPSDWDQAIRLRRTVLPIYGDLQGQAPPLIPGWHQRVFANGRVVLNVYHGDVACGLADLARRQSNPIDAWFLDGFAPDKNPDMWTRTLLGQLAELSNATTTVATFSAAGQVKRDLQAVGFEMRKVDQRPFKRESLAGQYREQSTRTQTIAPTQVTIHGAGLAGAFVARHLAEAGVTVHVFDPSGIAQGASALPNTVLHARLMTDGSASAELYSSAFHYASTYLRRFEGFNASGVIWSQGDNLNIDKLSRISDTYGANDRDQHPWIHYLSPSDSIAVAGLTAEPYTAFPRGALFHPTGGTIATPLLVKTLLAHDQIHIHQRHGQVDEALPNVACTATDIRRFAGCDLLEVTPVYGQLDAFDWVGGKTTMPVVGNGYLVPTDTGCLLGTTYEHHQWDRQDATSHNLATNAHLLGTAKLSWVRRHRGARCVASDRSPVVGKLNTQQDNFWMLTGLGSTGTSVGALAAAAISAELLGWLPPLAPEVVHLMRPGRFQERQSRRGVRHIKPMEPL